MTHIRLLLGVAIGLASPAPALAATAAEFRDLESVSDLAPWLDGTAASRLMTLLELPPGQPPSYMDAVVPEWRELRARLDMLPREAEVAPLRGRLEPGPEPVAAAWRLPGTFSRQRYAEAVGMLAGLASRPWPGNPSRRARFTNRLMGHPGNQLGEVVDYLKAYYGQLGLMTEEQTFSFRGKPYRNLAVTIPGRSAETVLLVDHFDVAETADYDRKRLETEAPRFGLTIGQIAAIARGHRRGAPVPGADDNASATAALMEAAHMLAGTKPAKTIKLLHLNGEEFPGDCFGARQWAGRAIRRGDPIAGVVVMDMIAVNRTKDRIFQLAVGRHPASHELAALALGAAGRHAVGYKPRVRGFSSPRSYLYNTDGQIFSGAGYPTLLLNEHVNYHVDLERLGYHDEFDRPELFDWAYAEAIATTGIAAAWRLAETAAPRWPAVSRLAPMLRSRDDRAAHFRVELTGSELFESVRASMRKDDVRLTAREVYRLVEADRASRDPDAIARRMAGWFPEVGLPLIDTPAIADEVTYLALRQFTAPEAVTDGAEPGVVVDLRDFRLEMPPRWRIDAQDRFLLTMSRADQDGDAARLTVYTIDPRGNMKQDDALAFAAGQIGGRVRERRATALGGKKAVLVRTVRAPDTPEALEEVVFLAMPASRVYHLMIQAPHAKPELMAEAIDATAYLESSLRWKEPR